MDKSAVVRKRRSYPHGCALDPEVVNNDFIEDNVGGSHDSDRTIESDMFVTMVSTCACMCVVYVYLYVQFICVFLFSTVDIPMHKLHAPPSTSKHHTNMHHRIVTNYLKVLLC